MIYFEQPVAVAAGLVVAVVVAVAAAAVAAVAAAAGWVVVAVKSQPVPDVALRVEDKHRT